MTSAKIIAQLEGAEAVKIRVDNINFDESRDALSAKIGKTIVDALYNSAEGVEENV